MRKKKNNNKKFLHFLIINIIAIGIFFALTDTKAADTNRVMELYVGLNGANVVGVEISIEGTSANGKTNEIGICTIDANIDTNIDTSKPHDVKIKTKYSDTQKFKVKSIRQKIYDLGEETKDSEIRVVNLISVIKNEDATVHYNVSDKLKSINSKMKCCFANSIDSAIAKADDLNKTYTKNVVIYYGTMTEQEKVARKEIDSMSGNPIPIIELETEINSNNILQKLADEGYIAIKEEEIKVDQQEDYAIGQKVTVGGNVTLDITLEEDSSVTPTTPPPNMGSGTIPVTISGKVEGERNLGDLNNNIQLTVKSGTNNVAGPFTLSTLNYSISNVMLDKDKDYYLEFEFTEGAFKKGYSTQEFYIDKLREDNNVKNRTTKIVYAEDIYRRSQYHEHYKEIDNDIESNNLDTYNDKTKLIAKTETFTIDEWTNSDLTIGQTNEIKSSFKLIPREKIEISLEKKISAIKIVLQDGSVFLEEKNPEITGGAFKMIHMDDELMHGATVYVEYEITAKLNDNDEIFESVTIIDILDDEVKNGIIRNIYYDPACKLITEEKTNSEKGWTNENNKEVRCTLNKDNSTTKIVTSQVITKDTEAAYNNSVYIERYKTSTGKRNGNWNTNIEDSYKKAGKETKVTSPEVKILPPFGN